MSPRSKALARRHLFLGASVATLVAAAPAFAGSGNNPFARIVDPSVAAAQAAQTRAAQGAAASGLAGQALADFQRVSTAISAQKAAQAAAAQAAAATQTAIPNGLGAGGLVIDPRVTAGTDPNLWVNASAPAQTTSGGQTTVTITQTSQRALLTWESFNVGQSTTVNFDQSAGNSPNGNSWVALNRIDAAGDPAKILGHIKAQGTVLILDPNGVIFGPTAQVNVHSLIAAAAEINGYSGAGGASVFNNGSGAYLPVVVNGVAQTTPGGTAILAPPTEDSANAAYLANGLFSSSGKALIFSIGVPGTQSDQGVIVQQGAQISTDVSGFDNGGLVALIGPNVVNSGTITVTAGQIALAANPNVWLIQQPQGNPNQTYLTVSNNSGQGIYGPGLIYTAAAVTGGATAANTAQGVLVSNDGNISFLGNAVNQLGVAEATTSVTRAGSVSIWADNLLTFGPQSVTAILPDENGETIPQNSITAFVAPTIAINAADVDFQGASNGQPGALVEAPGAAMTVATTNPYNGSTVQPTGRVFMESGSTIDLAGMNATASVDDYLYTFKVTANDVADTPLAQNLIGQTVTIDLRMSGVRADGLSWIGSPLFSATGAGYLSDVPRTIDELLTKGGSLSFTTTGSSTNANNPFTDVLQAAGSIINVSGGATTFTGGRINTTNLIASNGQVYNIGDADPTLVYGGFAGTYTASSPHWGVSQTYTNPLVSSGYYDPGYVDGVSAGSISVTAVNPVIEGTLIGGVQTGLRQAVLAQADTGPSGTQATPDQLPIGAALAITTVPAVSGGDGDAVVLQNQASSILGADFTMSTALKLPTLTMISGQTTSGPTTSAISQLTYSTDVLSAAGFGSISFTSSSALSMVKGAVLSVLPGGSVKLSGVTELDGTINAPAGKITIIGFSNGNFVLAAPPTPQLTIGPDALLNAAGLWVNDSNATAIQGSAYINGGAVTIETYAEGTVEGPPGGGILYTFNSNNQIVYTYPIVDTTQSIMLSKGSVIDVSSGGYVQTNGKLKLASSGLPAGNGGAVSLLTYVGNSWQNEASRPGDYELSQGGNLEPDGGNNPNQANIFMDGAIYSAGFANGGTLALQAPSIQVGGVSAVTPYTTGAKAGELALPASFFSSSGFANYSLTSTYGNVTVVAGAPVLLQQQNYLIDGSVALPATGALVRDFAPLGLAPAGERQPVGLSLTQQAYAYGATGDVSTTAGVLVQQGASIVGEPGASIALTASGPVAVFGDITAPGGSISLLNNGVPEATTTVSQGGNVGAGVTQAAQEVWVGSTATLDVSGVFVPNPTVSLYETGKVLAGGSILLQGATVVAMPGSTFDLAGASATIQLPGAGVAFGRLPLTDQAIWSNGGSLSIESGAATGALAPGLYEAAYFDGTIDAQGGAAQASGGTLTVGGLNGVGYSAIIVSQSGQATAGFKTSALGSSDPLYPLLQPQLTALLPNTSSVAFINADALSDSKLDSVNLMANTIGFSGDVTVKVPDALVLAGQIALLPAGATSATFHGATIGGTTVDLDAGYVLLTGRQGATPTLSDGVLNVNASSQIDLAGAVVVSNAADVNLNSGGDIRFLSDTDALFSQGMFVHGSGNNSSSYFLLQGFASQTQGQSIVQTPGMMVVADNLTLTGREAYPSTDSAFLLMSRGLGSGAGEINTITINSNGRTPVSPFSVDGEILIDAPTIVQNGALYAPLGTIQLGVGQGQSIPADWSYMFSSPPTSAMPAAVATQTLTLNPGSITSVSAAGLDLPYGTTINNTSWTAVSAPILSSDGDNNPAMTAPPAKTISLNGAAVNSEKGAVLDLSGGGDIYATEFVPGTGGSRNVLTSAGAGQSVFALVPSYEAAVAPTDPTYGAFVAPGTSVKLAGGHGVAAGTYTLMPALYATMPGAYRVVVVSNNVAPSTSSSVQADGSIYTTGTLLNSITGARSAQSVQLEIQSSVTWMKYSEIDAVSANAYFPTLAAAAGAQSPLLPIDGGQLVVQATNSLSLQGTNNFSVPAGGRGGSVDIGGANLLILAPDLTEQSAYASAGYIVLSSDQLSNLGAQSLLIGGERTQVSDGIVISPTAANVVIETDAAHPLTAPDLLVVASPIASSTPSYLNVDNPNTWNDQVTIPTPVAGSGAITVLPGSVIQSKGVVSSTASTVIHLGVANSLPANLSESILQNYYSGNYSPSGSYLLSDANPVSAFYEQAYSGGGLAALLEVSNGHDATVVRAPQTIPSSVTVAGGQSYSGGSYTFTPPPLPAVGTVNVGASAVVSGGNVLALSGSNVTVGANAALSGSNVTLSASAINLGNAPVNAAGLTLSSSVVQQFAGAQSLTLQSGSSINFFGAVQLGAADAPIGLLTLDGGGLNSDGGVVGIAATNVQLVNSQGSAAGASLGSGGTLALNASGAVTFGAGAKTFDGFSAVGIQAGQQILFEGTGGLDARGAAVTLGASDVVVGAAASQSVTTTGALTLNQGAGAAPAVAATAIGGALTLTGSSVVDNGTITALAGNIRLQAMTGDVVLNSGAEIDAAGSHIVLFDQSEDAPGGTVQLVANAGNVTLAPGSTINVAATGSGFAGTVAIASSPTGTVTLGGTLAGGAAYNDLGGNFALSAGSLSGALPFSSGFTGSFAVTLGQGDILVPANVTLTSGQVLLTANNGGVVVDGTIDASGPTGGSIQLYGAGTSTAAAGTSGASGVTLASTAKLLAEYKADDAGDPASGNGESTLTQNGGVITLGVTGTPDGSYNSTYGYEKVDGSGAVTVAQGAVLNVSGGPGGANISNNGGQIIIRAPLLTSGNVNVSFQGQVATAANGGPSGTGVVLDAYAVWSATDSTSGGQHFDGIIDPAGWFNPNGTMVDGVWQDIVNGSLVIIATETGGVRTATAAGQDDVNTGFFVPTTPNGAHTGFYQSTLVGFAQQPFADSAAVAADFNGATGVTLGSTLHLRPEIDLVNPSPSINGGDVTVASNWNLGAGTYNASTGGYAYAYRTTGVTDPGEPGALVLRAVNNVQINATISDGFYEPSDPFFNVSLPSVSGGIQTYSSAYSLYNYPLTSLLPSEMPGLAGMQAPPRATQFPTSYNLADQDVWYSEYYAPYVISGLRSLISPGDHLASQYKVVGASGSTFDNNLNDYPSYTAYLAAYNASYAGTSFAAGAPAAVTGFNNDPTAYANYAAYVAAYRTYSSAFVSYTASFYAANTGTANLPPSMQAPAPPPAYGSGYEGSASTYQSDYQSYMSNAYTSYAGYFSGYPTQPGGKYQYQATSFWLMALPYLPAITATPNPSLSVTAAAGPANAIANNPGINVTVNGQGQSVTLADYNTTTAANLMPEGLGGSRGSYSYDIVAGAVFGATPSANPNAVIAVPATVVTVGPNPSDSVTINGHTTYASVDVGYDQFDYDYTPRYQSIDVPTLLRTGTGSITIDAAGSFELLDTVSPGVVYTAGAATTTLPADYVAPVTPLPITGVQTNALLSTPSWGVNGGAVTISVGADIVGVEAPSDADGSQTLVAGAPTGEFWSAWYYRNGLTSGEVLDPFDQNYEAGRANNNPNYLPAQQNTTWINYGTFTQGIGALGGGNISLKAGGDIYDISASLPETIQVSGGLTVNGPAPSANFYGGGDLSVQAGGNLYSGLFYVGRGAGSIRVGGAVAPDALNPVTGTATQYVNLYSYPGIYGTPQSLPLLLAVQDGFISVTAAQSVSLGGVFDPTEIPQSLSQLAAGTGFDITPSAIGATFQSYGPRSGVALTSIGGDVGLDTLADLNGYNSAGSGLQGTTLFSWNASSGQSNIYGPIVAPAVLDAVSFAGDVDLQSKMSMIASPNGQLVLFAGQSITTEYVDTAYINTNFNALTMLDGTASAFGPASLLGIPAPSVLPHAVHADDTDPAIIYAGGDITGMFQLIKPAKIEAGVDILNTTFVGQNNNPSDVTSIIAGRDIAAEPEYVSGQLFQNSSSFQLYGPGAFLVQAGRNLGPFFSGPPGTGFTGIEAVGDGSNLGSTSVKSYLPVQGADVYALFGVGGGIDYQAAIDDYINPASAGTGGIDYLTYIAGVLNQSPSEAWATFQGLPAAKQQMLIDQAFLNFLSQVGLDYNNPASPYHGQYARAYAAIANLFPASSGYTDNSPASVNGSAQTVHTGDLSMAHSLLETQTGGNIYVLGPGGNIEVGENATDNSRPSQEGILTLQGGSILTYTDKSVIVDQSRIFTEQGGDIDMFTANGDLNAGKGPKSSASFPPLTLIWDVDGYTRVNPAGLVTGAGIGALLSVPGQDPTLSNANLVAPRGTVDAGAAGIRVAGNLNIVALQVLNAFNIQVGGTATGLPAVVQVNVGALTSASSATAAVSQIAQQIERSARPPAPPPAPSIFTIEFLGFGEDNQ